MKHPTYDEIKNGVRTMWKALKGTSREVKISCLYEKVSAAYGYPNWDTFSAVLKNNLSKINITA